MTTNRIAIELYTSDCCPRCQQARDLLAELTREIGALHFHVEYIDVVKNIDRSVSRGVLRVPTLFIDHKLIGDLPAREQLKQLLKNHVRY